jgi:integrase
VARACAKAQVAGVTTRDIRPFALTTAEQMGYNVDELRKAAAHTSVETTEGYLGQYRQVVSNVRLTLPAILTRLRGFAGVEPVKCLKLSRFVLKVCTT